MSSVVLRLVTLLAVSFLSSLAWGKGATDPSPGQGDTVHAVGAGRDAGQGKVSAIRATDPLPATPEEWVVRMLDATRNGLAFKHPEAFIEWLDALSEPRFLTALATVALDPKTYPKALGQGIDPSAARNWAEFADPNLYLRWLLAGMDGRFYTALLSRMANPEKLHRWINFATRPEAYAPMFKAMSPSTSADWGQALGTARNYEPLIRLTHPETSLAWVSAFADGVAKRVAPGEDGQWLRLPKPFTPAQGRPAGAPQRY